MLKLASFAAGEWVGPGSGARPIFSAVSGKVIAEAGGTPLDTGKMLDYAKTVGGPALRAMGFHDRAGMLKTLALYLNERREALYELSYDTGATGRDHMVDIDGGIGTTFVFASKGRKELPDGDIYIDGGLEQLGKTGTFLGQHVAVPLQGVAVHINAFNFPLWGMLEKLAPTLLAGVPAIVKPATASSYVTEAAVRMIVESGILPEGAIQFIAGSTGDLLDNLSGQDVVSFTGSAATGTMLRATPNILASAVRFTAEQDSLNATILGPDVVPGSPAFDVFIKEVHREMTTKAGQKCTAIRRIIAPEARVPAVIEALSGLLAATPVGDPRDKATRMGALVSADQKADVLAKAAIIGEEAERVFGDPDHFVPAGDVAPDAFVPPMLFHCADPDAATKVHATEAFGPVSTVMPYRDLDHAIAIANRGEGSLVASCVTESGDVARAVVRGSGAYHGRLYFNNPTSAKEATGHGSTMAHMVHGGPGRAGGGEELGGIRAVLHYMQRVAVQGSPDLLTAVTDTWVPGAAEIDTGVHPFTRSFGALQIGETIHAGPREITLEDIEHFAAFTGDTFYAHMDEEAAAANPFFPGRVAHGYLLLSFAAGLFVRPDPGPVLANTGLDALRFVKPVVPGDTLSVRLTVKQKTRRTEGHGEVRWHVTLTNQDAETVAEYELLTMNAV
ncbi:MAG: phenylacetic acid degradation bifunctional protein PaaZ [Maritimibacter sp.]|nr:phenylacetic acid degradation bifunctional protein PaaZ [Maritimibacter sp.]